MGLGFVIYLAGQTPPLSAAMITALSGDVQIVRVPAPPVRAQLLAALYAGDTLRAGPESQATILYSNGRIVCVNPSTAIPIEAPTEEVRGGSPDETAGLSGSVGRVFAFIAESEKTTANLTVRGPEDSLALSIYEPGNTSLLDSTPRIIWGLYPSAQTYHIKIQRQGTDLVNIITVDTAVAYPIGRSALTPGRYLLRVMACGTVGETLSVTDRVFAVMYPDIADSITRALTAVQDQHPDQFTGHLLAAKIYEEKNMRLSAIAEYRAILLDHPDEPLIHRALSNLYRELGLPRLGNWHLDRYEELTVTK